MEHGQHGPKMPKNMRPEHESGKTIKKMAPKKGGKRGGKKGKR